MIYQHEARGADKAITDAIDKHIADEKRQEDSDQGAIAGGRLFTMGLLNLTMTRRDAATWGNLGAYQAQSIGLTSSHSS